MSSPAFAPAAGAVLRVGVGVAVALAVTACAASSLAQAPTVQRAAAHAGTHDHAAGHAGTDAVGTEAAGNAAAHTEAAGSDADARFAREMDASMQQMMRDMHAPGYSGDPDADFLAMMIAHHQGAIDMARLALVHGRDPLVRQLAEEIIAGQATEIAAMRARLARLRAGGDAAPDGFPALGATRGLKP